MRPKLTGPEEDAPLNHEMRLFVKEYVGTWNASEAYRKVYKNAQPRSAASTGWKLLQLPRIKKAIKEECEQWMEETIDKRYRALWELERLAHSSLKLLMDEDGNWLPKSEWSAEAIAAVASVEEITTEIPGTGEKPQVKTQLKIRLWDKTKNLQNLMTYYKMLIEKSETRTADDDPMLELMREVLTKGQSTQKIINIDDDKP